MNMQHVGSRSVPRAVNSPLPGRSTLSSRRTCRSQRLTTVGIGGPARRFARPETLGELEALVRWAAAEGSTSSTVGLGSNVLAADAGVDALVVRLAGELARRAHDGVGARRGRRRGERGLPAPCAGRGPRRHGVRLRDPRHGGRRRAHERRRVRARLVGDRPSARSSSIAAGSAWKANAELGARPTAARRSAAGRSWPRSSSSSSRAPRAEIRSTVAELNATRKATQPTNKRTFGSVFKNPRRTSSARGGCSMPAACAGTGSEGPRSRRDTRTSSRTSKGRRRPTPSP